MTISGQLFGSYGPVFYKPQCGIIPLVVTPSLRLPIV